MRTWVQRWLARWRNETRLPGHLRSGLWGEREAARRLKEKGYRILARRVRFGPRLELDLVALDPDGTLVFVEVKTRADEDFGRPMDSVSREKRRHVTAAAWQYLRRLGRRRPDYFRFDVVEVIGREGDLDEIRHIENAFPAEPDLRVPW